MNQDLIELLACASDNATRERLMRFIRANQGRRIWIPTAGLRNPEAARVALNWLNGGMTRAEVARRVAALNGRPTTWGQKRVNEALQLRFSETWGHHPNQPTHHKRTNP